MEALLTVIFLWITANFDISANYEHPQIVFSSPETIAAVSYHSLLSAAERGAAETQSVNADQRAQSQIVATYVDETRTIHLPQDWTGTTPEELSILVHEMVHHLQNLGQIRHACAQEREKLAFASQERWLSMFGSNLKDAFGVNEFTLLLRTNCAF